MEKDNLFDVMIEKRQSYRVSIRNAKKNTQQQMMRDKFIQTLECNPLYEIQFFKLILNDLAQMKDFESMNRMTGIVKDIYLKMKLFESEDVRREAIKLKTVSALIEGIPQQVFDPEIEKVVIEILKQISKYKNMAGCFYPYTEIILQMLDFGLLDEMGLILSNMIESETDLASQLVKFLMRNKTEEIIASKIQSTKAIQIWPKFLADYVQKLSQLRLQPNYTSIQQIISYLKHCYIYQNLPQHLQSQIQLFISVSNYQFLQTQQNILLVKKMVKKFNYFSLQALQNLAIQEPWIIDNLIYSLSLNSSFNTYNRAIQTLSILLQRIQDPSLSLRIIAKINQPQLKYLIDEYKTKYVSLWQLYNKSINRHRQMTSKKQLNEIEQTFGQMLIES